MTRRRIEKRQETERPTKTRNIVNADPCRLVEKVFLRKTMYNNFLLNL